MHQNSDQGPSGLCEAEKAKRSVTGPLLAQRLTCDYFMTIHIDAKEIKLKKFQKSTWPQLKAVIEKGLETKGSLVFFNIRDSPIRIELGLGQQVDAVGPALIIGPQGGPNSSEAQEFRDFWGPNLCQLRRFEDGSIRETIELRNQWGPAFVIPAIVQHLVATRFASLKPRLELIRLP